MSQPLLDAALIYAAHEMLVLPASVSTKRPRTPHGLLDASRDERVIRSWPWDDNDAALAVRTGAVSRLVVLDVDGDDGEDSLCELERRYGLLPDSIEVLTPHGSHRHFAYPPDVGLVRCAVAFRGLPHLDVRGDGGYVLVPPTPGYAFDVSEHPLAVLPAVLIGNTDGWSDRPTEEEVIRLGTRNTVLTSLGGSMRRRGMSPEAIRAALLADNRARCDPPLANEEVENIAKSVLRYAPAERVGTRHRPSEAQEHGGT
jgi:hypothetical protein